MSSPPSWLDSGLVRSGEPLRTTGGLIPVGGMSPVRAGNVILAGDAAGHCHPITGAGVPGAVFAGRMAGEAAAAAAAADNQEPLAEYEEACALFLGESWRQAVEKRQRLSSHWQDDDEELSRMLRRSWIAFPEYYEH